MNINNIVIFILVLSIVSLSITIGVKNNSIDKLRIELSEAKQVLAQANAMISMQNLEINKYKVNVEKSNKEYEAGLKQVKENYEKKLSVAKDNMSCDEILKIIANNQKEYLK